MRKLFLSLPALGAAVLLFTATAGAQNIDTTNGGPWQIGIETALGATQAAYSDNWTGGEAGSIIWVSGFRGTASKGLGAAFFWGNELKLEFGQTHTQIDSTKHWLPPRKSSDKIRYDTIVRLMRGWAVDPYTAGILESQFLGMDSLGRNVYFNPVDLTEAIGVARDLFNVPDERVLTTRLGFGLRQHMFYNETTTNDGGLEWVTDLTLGSPNTKYSFVSKLSVFQALFNSQEDEMLAANPATADYWKAADLNWDNTLRGNLTSLLQVGLGWQLLYDKEIDLGGRFKETLTLGLSYKFANTN